MPTIDQLIVQIDASTELLRRELQKGDATVADFARKTETRLGGVADKFKNLGAGIRTALGAFGVGLSVAGIARFTVGAIQAADAIGETAKSAGFGAERFQRLQFVFKRNGVEAEEFASSLRALNTRFGQYLTTGAGPAAKAIEDLGLKQDIANGTIKTSEQLFDAVSNKLRTVGSAAERAALSAALFGREAGPKMQDTLAQGTAALDEMGQAAQGVFDDATIRKADALGDAIDRLAMSTGNWFKSLAIEGGTTIGTLFGVDELQNLETAAEKLERLIALRDHWNATGSRRFGSERQFAGTLEELNAEIEARQRLAKFSTGGGFGGGGPNDEAAPPAVVAETPEERRKRQQREREAARFASLQPIKPGIQMPRDLQQFDFAGAIRQAEQSRLETITPLREGMAQRLGMLQLPIKEMDAAIKRSEELSKSLEETKRRSEEFADSFASAFESRGIDALLSGDIKGAIRGLTQDFAEMIIRLTVLRPLAESIAGSLGGIGGGAGGFFSSIFGGGKAKGGPVKPGVGYIVGEKGAEWFEPKVAGRILNQKQMAAAVRAAESTERDSTQGVVSMIRKGEAVERSDRRLVGRKGPALFLPKSAESDVGKKMAMIGRGQEQALALLAPRRAEGGPVAAGARYLVGEKEREWFVPDVAGRIMNTKHAAAAASPGMVVQQTFNIQAGLPPQWEVQLAGATQVAAKAAYEAVTNKMAGRR